MKKENLFNKENLVSLIEKRLGNNDLFGLLDDLCRGLRRCNEDDIVKQLYSLIRVLRENKLLGQNLATQLCRWLCSMRLYPLLISRGILPREGFGREMRKRLYERINPSFKDVNDLRDVFFLLFNDKDDALWLNAVPLKYWDTLLNLLRRYTSAQDREMVNNHFRHEGLLAIEMLSIWLAAEEMEPELIRLDPVLLDADSPLVALQREVSHWVEARRKNTLFDSSHLEVMFSQSTKLIGRLKKRGASAGSSLEVAYLLERLAQTLERLASLMDVFTSNRFLPRRILLLTGHLAAASADKHSVKKLWKQSVKMLARSITQNTSDHGEHYITRNKQEYLNMFYSAAAGGIFIALMALIKISLGEQIEDKVWKGVAESLNYSLGFIIIFILHCTVATKQPAMTAARFADAVGRNPQGRAVNMKLAQLLVDVFRSQSIAVLGNVSVAVALSSIIAIIYDWIMDKPFLDMAAVEYQLYSIDPTKGTLWFAAIAGVWLFCAGIIAGYFDNRCNYLNLRMRLKEHPLLKRIMPTNSLIRFAEYMHQNYGSIMGNICFGFLLGLTGVIGYLTDLPLDIRHVALSSANVGYATLSGNLSCAIFIQSLCFVLLIGLVNLIVSFSLTLWVALRSLEAEIDSWKDIANSVWKIIKQRPLSIILPLQLEEKS